MTHYSLRGTSRLHSSLHSFIGKTETLFNIHGTFLKSEQFWLLKVSWLSTGVHRKNKDCYVNQLQNKEYWVLHSSIPRFEDLKRSRKVKSSARIGLFLLSLLD